MDESVPLCAPSILQGDSLTSGRPGLDLGSVFIKISTHARVAVESS